MTSTPAQISQPPSAIAGFVVLGLFVALACWFSISLTRLAGSVSTIWIASGLLTGVLLSCERRLWAGYLAAAYAGILIARALHGDPWYLILGVGFLGILEAFLVASAIVHFVGNDVSNPAKIKRLGWVATGSTLCACVVSGVMAASIQASASKAPFVPVLATWFAAHTLGMVIFATLTGLALHRRGKLLGRPGQRLGFGISLALNVAVCLLVFAQTRYSVLFLVYPPLLYCIFRYRMDGVVVGIALVVIISTTETLAGNGPLNMTLGVGVNERAILLQVFLAVTCLIAFPIVIMLTDSSFLARGLRESERELAQQNTQLQALNQKLLGAQAQLLQSEKMASIGQLAAGVAHEINNPIGYVRSNLASLTRYLQKIFSVLKAYEQAETSLSDVPLQLAAVRALKHRVELDYVREDIVSLLAESVEGVTRVEKIVKDLNEFSRIDEAEWQQADVHECINSTLNVIWHELKYKGELVKAYGDLPPIQCLPFQLKQVFMNLLINAAHAIERAGTITIRTGRDGERVWITIADTGQGIDSDHISRIFDPFFTTKPVGAGTGLGLSVSYGIIKKHGGSLDVASDPGSGTTFTIRLPITLPALPIQGPAALASSGAA